MNTNPTAEELYEFVSWVTDRFVAGDYATVDRMLVLFDMTVHESILVCAVRTTFPARDKLAHWVDAVSKVRTELLSRGLDGDKLLRGLIIK